MNEFAKILCFWLLLAYSIGIVYIAVLCWRDTSQTYNLADVLKLPVSLGLIGYFLKAGAENKEKIKKSVPESLGDICTDETEV